MSLRFRLMLLIGSALTVLWSCAAIWMLHDLDKQLRNTLDQRLEMSAQMVAGLMSSFPPDDTLANPILAHTRKGIACQVSSMRGAILTQTPKSATPGSFSTKIGYSNQVINGEHWRSYTLQAHGVLVTTADRLAERRELFSTIHWATSLPFILALPGGLLVLWIGIHHSLKPLERLRQALLERQPDDLEKLGIPSLPVDIKPLVDSLNSLLARMGQTLDRERQFSNDAAHELRTPLTAIKTHLQVARMSSGADMHTALKYAEQGADRLQNTLNQLLLLARLEGPFTWENDTPIWSDEVLQTALRDAAPLEPQQIQVEGIVSVRLETPQALAVAALRNLIDNAIRYSPAGAPVQIKMLSTTDRVVFCVNDRGPGIPPQNRGMATQRFWRDRANNNGHCGLGLAIVSAIALRFGGKLSLLDNPGGGLQARLELPRLADR